MTTPRSATSNGIVHSKRALRGNNGIFHHHHHGSSNGSSSKSNGGSILSRRRGSSKYSPRVKCSVTNLAVGALALSLVFMGAAVVVYRRAASSDAAAAAEHHHHTPSNPSRMKSNAVKNGRTNSNSNNNNKNDALRSSSSNDPSASRDPPAAIAAADEQQQRQLNPNRNANIHNPPTANQWKLVTALQTLLQQQLPKDADNSDKKDTTPTTLLHQIHTLADEARTASTTTKTTTTTSDDEDKTTQPRITHKGSPESTSSSSSNSPSSLSTARNKIAVMVQLGSNLHLLPDMTTCLANVASAVLAENDVYRREMQQQQQQSDERWISFDLHIAGLQPNSDDNSDEGERMQEKIHAFWHKLLEPDHSTRTVAPNKGADIGAFLTQLKMLHKDQNRTTTLPNDNDTPKKEEPQPLYDLYLKIHTKTDPIWRQQMLESLCGTQEQVQSVFQALLPTRMNPTATTTSNKTKTMAPVLLAPQGTLFGPQTTADNIFPHILQKYKWKSVKKHKPSLPSQPAGPAFDHTTIDRMNKIKVLLLTGQDDQDKDPIFDKCDPDLRACTVLFALAHLTETLQSAKKELRSIYPRLRNDIWALEDEVTQAKELFRGFRKEDLSIVAGTCFWVNDAGLRPRLWVDQYDKIYSKLTVGYTENLGWEHAIERVFPSLVMNDGGQVLTIQPAPRPMALYFPQYHSVPENNKFWGQGFTEWTLLRNLTLPGVALKKPLPVEQGGLGYYDLEDFESRQGQSTLARRYGVQAFCYYHYWFSGDHAPPNHLVMGKIPEARLRDGEPSVPFMLSWANEPWTKRWTGQDSETLLSQSYGANETDWIQHYEYLVPFFKNEYYVRINNAPIFAIYRPGHVDPDKLGAMIDCWQRVARERGDFPDGLHIVQTVGNFYKNDRKDVQRISQADVHFDGSFQFWPQMFASFRTYFDKFGNNNVAAGIEDLELGATTARQELNPEDQSRHSQYWGAFVGFDRRPRDPKAPAILVSPQQFQKHLCQSFLTLSMYNNRSIATNLYFITAWNEWNEQAVLEPNMMDGFGYLEALNYCLRNVPVTPVEMFPDLEKRRRIAARNKAAREEKKKPTSLWRRFIKTIYKILKYIVFAALGVVLYGMFGGRSQLESVARRMKRRLLPQHR